MELTGTVSKVMDAQQITPTFTKREMVLTTEEQYPQTILVEFTQDKTGLLDNIKSGDKVTVSINIRGREWKSPQGDIRYFTSIQGWRISAAGAGGMDEMPPMEEYSSTSSNDDDDLPF